MTVASIKVSARGGTVMKWLTASCLLVASFLGASTGRSAPPNPCEADPNPCANKPGTHCEWPGGTTKPMCVANIPTVPEPKTIFNQAWASIGNTAYIFAVQYDPLKPDDGHVFMNFFVKGTSSSTWYDLGGPASGDGTIGALSGPSAVGVDGLIFLTVANIKDHTICLNQGGDTNWTGWVCR